MHGPKDQPHQGWDSPQDVMAKEKVPPQKKAAYKGGKAASEKAGWAVGLRQLYDSVVDEPLPDSFQDLLSKLDGADK